MMNATKPLPDGWRAVRLSGVCQLNPSRPLDLLRSDGEPVTFVPMQAIDGTEGRIARPEARPFRDVRKGYTYFAENDVLFAKITPCMQNGKHAIARDLIGGFGFGTTEFHIIRHGPEITPEWIHFFVRQPQVLENAKAYFTGAVGQQRVPETYLARLEIPLPPLAEQKRIAAILSEQMAAMERARAAAEDQLEAAKALSGAYFRHAFQGLTPLSVRPANGIVPSGWRWVLLTKVARLESGHTPSRYHPEWWGGSIPWIALPDIRNLDGKTAYETSECTNEAGIANSSARILPAGTVVLSRTASVGFVTVMGREMATSQDFVDWICGPDLNPHFLAYLLRAARDYIRSLSSGAIHQTVYVPTVKRFQICLPSGTEQESIVKGLSDQLDAAEQAQKAIETELDAINKLPAAILRRAFSGEL